MTSPLPRKVSRGSGRTPTTPVGTSNRGKRSLRSTGRLARGRQPPVTHGWRLRIDELNTVAWGAAAAGSRRFASALCARHSVRVARGGVEGVNIHTFPAAGYELFSFDRSPAPGAHRWRRSTTVADVRAGHPAAVTAASVEPGSGAAGDTGGTGAARTARDLLRWPVSGCGVRWRGARQSRSCTPARATCGTR